jgi:hypothetical protein
MKQLTAGKIVEGLPSEAELEKSIQSLAKELRQLKAARRILQQFGQSEQDEANPSKKGVEQ